MLRCPRCEVICSWGKDANSHWKEGHGENVVGYTCGKCEKKFERLTQVSCHFARCQSQKSASTSERRFEFRCELSGYDSQRCLSQHMRARHPKEFHMRLKVEDNRKQKRDEDAELITLAEARQWWTYLQIRDTSRKLLLRWEESNKRVSRSAKCASVKGTKSLCKS